MVIEKMKTIFPLKDCNSYPSCKICNSICSGRGMYIGETTCNIGEHWSKYVSVNNKS